MEEHFDIDQWGKNRTGIERLAAATITCLLRFPDNEFVRINALDHDGGLKLWVLRVHITALALLGASNKFALQAILLKQCDLLNNGHLKKYSLRGSLPAIIARTSAIGECIFPDDKFDFALGHATGIFETNSDRIDLAQALSGQHFENQVQLARAMDHENNVERNRELKKTCFRIDHLGFERTLNVALREIETSKQLPWNVNPEVWRAEHDYSYWLSLYEDLLKGQFPDWQRLKSIALIDDSIWQSGPEAVANAIEQIQAELLTKRAPQSEAVIFDETEQKFRLEYQDPVKPDLLNATLDQISDALEDCLENQSNGLHERSRETKVLRRALSRYANNPQRLEMDFTSVHGSLTRQILATNELPPSEENLALMKALQDGAQGIRATHPDIAENRSILTNRAIKEMSQEDLEAIKAAEPVLEEISFGELAKDFEDDVEEIIEQEKEEALHPNLGGAERNPGLAAYDEKVRLFSRVAKIVLLLKKSPETIQKIDKSAAVKVGGWISILYTLVQIGISLF